MKDHVPDGILIAGIVIALKFNLDNIKLIAFTRLGMDDRRKETDQE
jgi:hypothetical protein